MSQCQFHENNSFKTLAVNTFDLIGYRVNMCYSMKLFLLPGYTTAPLKCIYRYKNRVDDACISTIRRKFQLSLPFYFVHNILIIASVSVLLRKMLVPVFTVTDHNYCWLFSFMFMSLHHL